MTPGMLTLAPVYHQTGMLLGVVMPLALAFLLGFVLDPLVVRLKRWGLPRAPAVIVVVLFTLSLIGLGGLFLGNQVSTLSAQLPTYQSNITTKLRGLRTDFARPGVFDGVITVSM